ncbi:hypothetical protein HU200_044311 [Digitaria exilis]|uniref:Fe2OG dioxygenase domain-containing protein n=1 Tax=Digitaria exilis TaxID=1010633 RepID=A0A835EED0_9POAL|nr:hypothetical protein HU200_044311 [Digitaria exilis]CAB3493764.1 unnamed protein product [Digitaria exilis]
MATEARLPCINFTGVDPSSPGAGRWWTRWPRSAASTRTTRALSPDLRAAFFDGAVKNLLALPADAKRCNTYGRDKPLFGYLGATPGVSSGYESLAISERVEPERVRAFANLMWPDADNAGFSEAVHGAARWMAELEEAVQRMVMEELGVCRCHGAMSESMRHVFRMSQYMPPISDDTEGRSKEVIRHGTHQDCSMLTVICQHGEVDGLEVQTSDGEWVRFRPSSPASLVVMAGNELRAWTNDRVRAPFHRVAVGGDVARYSAILFALPGLRIQAPDELVDDEHPPRFKPHCNDDFMRFCIAQGARHEDKLRDFRGV